MGKTFLKSDDLSEASIIHSLVLRFRRRFEMFHNNCSQIHLERNSFPGRFWTAEADERLTGGA